MIFFLNKDVAKSTIAVSLPLGKRPTTERPSANLLGEYLDGDMGSLFFQEIREARGLAYYAGGFVAAGTRPSDDWLFMGRLGTQGDKTVEALDTYLEVLRRPIDDTRLASARTALDQSYRASRVDPRWIANWVRFWDLRGEKSDPRPGEWKAAAALTTAQLQEYASQITAPAAVVAIVGDKARIDLAALSKLGAVKPVEPKDLVSWGAFPKQAGDKAKTTVAAAK